MSAAVQAVRYLLAHNSPLTAVVAATGIMPGPLPQNTRPPAIALELVSQVRLHMVASTATEMCRARVQITLATATYAALHDAMVLVRAALPRSRGSVDGVFIEGVLIDTEGPEFSDPDSGLYFCTLDVLVDLNQ